MKTIDFEFHHVGCAVKNIKESLQYYYNIFGFEKFREISDKKQNLNCKFIKKNGFVIELLEKIDDTLNSPIDKILECFGGGVYHFCFSVNDIHQAIFDLEKKGFLKFHRKLIENEYYICIFMITPDNYLIELIEDKYTNIQ